MREKTYWYIPGNGYPALLAIRVYKAEKSCHDTGPGGYVFWWMSEPIGHAVTDDDLMTKAQAKLELAELKKIAHKDCKKISTLHDWRVKQAKFIISTHPKEDRMSVKEFLKQFPSEKETEWFS
jgi:hypothetical protein